MRCWGIPTPPMTEQHKWRDKSTHWWIASDRARGIPECTSKHRCRRQTKQHPRRHDQRWQPVNSFYHVSKYAAVLGAIVFANDAHASVCLIIRRKLCNKWCCSVRALTCHPNATPAIDVCSVRRHLQRQDVVIGRHAAHKLNLINWYLRETAKWDLATLLARFQCPKRNIKHQLCVSRTMSFDNTHSKHTYTQTPGVRPLFIAVERVHSAIYLVSNALTRSSNGTVLHIDRIQHMKYDNGEYWISNNQYPQRDLSVTVFGLSHRRHCHSFKRKTFNLSNWLCLVVLALEFDFYWRTFVRVVYKSIDWHSYSATKWKSMVHQGKFIRAIIVMPMEIFPFFLPKMIQFGLNEGAYEEVMTVISEHERER